VSVLEDTQYFSKPFEAIERRYRVTVKYKRQSPTPLDGEKKQPTSLRGVGNEATAIIKISLPSHLICGVQGQKTECYETLFRYSLSKAQRCRSSLESSSNWLLINYTLEMSSPRYDLCSSWLIHIRHSIRSCYR
jgi:hypothetical protein